MKLSRFLRLCILLFILDKLGNIDRHYEMHPSVNGSNSCEKRRENTAVELPDVVRFTISRRLFF
jgi:hypothetical protein